MTVTPPRGASRGPFAATRGPAGPAARGDGAMAAGAVARGWSRRRRGRRARGLARVGRVWQLGGQVTHRHAVTLADRAPSAPPRARGRGAEGWAFVRLGGGHGGAAPARSGGSHGGAAPARSGGSRCAPRGGDLPRPPQPGGAPRQSVGSSGVGKALPRTPRSPPRTGVSGVPRDLGGPFSVLFSWAEKDDGGGRGLGRGGGGGEGEGEACRRPGGRGRGGTACSR